MLTRTFPRGILASLYLYIKAVLVLSPRQDGSPISRVEDDPSPFGRDCLVLELGDTHTGRTLTPKSPAQRGALSWQVTDFSALRCLPDRMQRCQPVH